ncbi:zinc ABC transporter substrate-binding protein [Rhodocaloribacter litoris]|uniref:metal ABC transporter solute-binding protein, Zn/Mn family n=1 Tax=Rhodocaloribacter litoris TaxID=2558931 RepID=UPI00141D7E88|nr:zinc ABC transporter substrate-binding protein [Rhodocaloribacter litoris]QXD14446.1 zinc ABC transporter substrate-binding protein [Rhodocaloribacter litoris]
MPGPLRSSFVVLLVSALLGTGCGRQAARTDAADLSGRPIRVVATTSLVADLVRHIGGERVDVTGLMGPGVDPHLYKASEGDVTRMASADVIFYNGLHLEGKMTEVFEQMKQRGIPTYAVTDGIDTTRYRSSAYFTGNYDPHIWFDVSLWMEAARYVAKVLATLDPAHAATYEANARRYVAELETLEAYVRARVAEIPAAQRVLITSHDAFGYFGRAYGFEVRGLQGISTATEAGAADVQALADFVATRRIPAMFVESSVSPRGIEAVRAAVRARGFDVRIGGTLYGDALGAPDTPAGTYTGMVRHNVDTIVDALLGRQTLQST